LLVERLLHVVTFHDVVPPKNRGGLMAGNPHGRRLRNTRAQEIPHSRASQIMEQKIAASGVPAGGPPGLAEFPNRFPSAVKDEFGEAKAGLVQARADYDRAVRLTKDGVTSQ
jgi:hypothetical protein